MMKFPQVLLVGNGLNILNGGEKWENFLKSISNKKTEHWFGKMNSPMTLQAILISNNTLDIKLKEKSKELMPKEKMEDKHGFWKTLLSVGFDDVLTTNYTYEIEQSYFGNKPLSIRAIEKLSANLKGDKAEPKYLISTCNRILNDKKANIWHIHGEARKPSSMILGHYYYVYLLNRIVKFIDDKQHTYKWEQERNFPNEIKSWIDSFILGDVYIIGQGFSFSEIDLWWLLNRKANEKAKHGDVYFYEPIKEYEEEKIALLDVFGAKVLNMGVKIENNADYEIFYERAIRDIKNRTLIRKNGKKYACHS